MSADVGEPVDPTEFRRLMARFATGVSVVTAREGSEDAGLTVNALLSVSLHPPMLLASLSTVAESTPVIERTRWFGVSLLSDGQRALSERFASTLPSAEKFAGVATHRGRSGVPLLDGTLATFECELERSIPVADHHLLLGRVVAAAAGEDGLPLLFYRSRYSEPAGPDLLRFAAPAPPDRSR